MLYRIFTSAAVFAAVLFAAACGSSEAAGRQSLGGTEGDSADLVARAAESKLPLSATAALDAGNAAYRAKQLDQAIAHYREATVIAPGHVAPWYGVFMAANEMKNTVLADSAMTRVKALSSDPSAYQAHAEAVSPAAMPELPAGHPTTQPLPPGHPVSTKPPTP